MSVRYVYMIADVGTGKMYSMLEEPLAAADLIVYPGDDIDFRIYFRSRTAAGEFENFAIGANDVLELTAKEDGDYNSGAVLVYSDNTQWNIQGDWDEEASRPNGACVVRVNLNTANLRAKLENDTASITLRFDLTITPAGRRPSTIQFTATCANDVRRGDEGTEEVDVHPDYATIDYLLAELRKVTHPANGRYKLEAGAIWLLDRSTAAWERYELSDGKLVRVES